MIRTLLLAACLAILSGCNASRKVVTNKGADASEPAKEYQRHATSPGRSLTR